MHTFHIEILMFELFSFKVARLFDLWVANFKTETFWKLAMSFPPVSSYQYSCFQLCFFNTGNSEQFLITFLSPVYSFWKLTGQD